MKKLPFVQVSYWKTHAKHDWTLNTKDFILSNQKSAFTGLFRAGVVRLRQKRGFDVSLPTLIAPESQGMHLSGCQCDFASDHSMQARDCPKLKNLPLFIWKMHR